MNKKSIFAASLVTGLLIAGSGAAVAIAETGQATVTVSDYCVTYGHGPSAAGNVVLYNWDNQPCPPGTYDHVIQAPVQPDPETSDTEICNPYAAGAVAPANDVFQTCAATTTAPPEG